MQFVEPGQAIFFDDSTTVLQMVPHLPGKGPLTVITNSLILMNEVRDIKDVTLLGLGGQLYNWCNAFVGGMTIHEIRRLRADVAFISIAAITDDLLFHQSPEMVETKRAMLDCAARRILLADHTKFERRALHNFGALSDFDVVIVDEKRPSRISSAWKRKASTWWLPALEQAESKNSPRILIRNTIHAFSAPESTAD